MTKIEFLKSSNLVESPLLYYVDGYKYQSRSDMVFHAFVYPDHNIVTDLIILRKDGWMWISKYFAWDGASGPTWDDSTNIRASLPHDAFGALFRMGLLDLRWLPASGDLLHRLMIEDGAAKIRADYYRYAVNDIYTGWADQNSARKMMVSPHMIKMNIGAPA